MQQYPLLFTPENVAFNLAALIQPKFLWLGFGAVLAFFCIFSLVLLYHWISYSYRPMRGTVMGILYFAGSAALIAGLFSSLALYTASL